AVRMTFLALTFLYLGAIIILVGVMPWNRAGVSESPFVTVFRSVDLPGASHLMNFVVLTAALSGANAALYVSSRMLFSLARTGWDSRVNLISGLALLIGLTALYFLLRPKKPSAQPALQ